jgi:uracil-DNA glycosylase
VTTKLDKLRAEAASCRDCDLWEHATQTVFGEGPQKAALMLMGEVPGDKEDRQGHVFVGPAGHILDDALAEAGIDRSTVYLTNAVKHFKWEPARNGKLRLHKTPNRVEITACKQWWERELALLQPKVFGLLGSVAAQAVLGPQFRVTKQRGEWFELPSGVAVTATIHPSAVLRAEERRAEEYAGLVRDLTGMNARLA